MALGRSAAGRTRARWLWLLWLDRFPTSADSGLGRRRYGDSGRCCCRDRAKAFDLVPLQQPVDENLNSRQLPAFFCSNERIGNALASHAAGSANPVYVVIG